MSTHDPMIHTMVFGTSEPQDFQLEDDLEPMVGTGKAVAIEWRTPAPTSLPTVAWLDQAAGTVRVTDTAAMPLGRYPFRFKLTAQAGGAVGYASNGAGALEWRVVRV